MGRYARVCAACAEGMDVLTSSELLEPVPCPLCGIQTNYLCVLRDGIGTPTADPGHFTAQALAAQRTREDAAAYYSCVLGRLGPSHPWWITINRAIIDRWSESGLEWIKRKAWGALGTGREASGGLSKVEEAT